MKVRKSKVQAKTHALPRVRFETQSLTSFSGLIIFQKFFAAIGLKERLERCFKGYRAGSTFKASTIFLQLIIHVLLGYRELRHCQYYKDDPLVKRLLGLRQLPDVSTLCRMLAGVPAAAVEALRRLLRELVLERLRRLRLRRVTLDFDGSASSTRRWAEGTAVGYNKKRKGERSYYPLFCTVAQTGQVLDFYHRPGNVHDSNGALSFVLACILFVRKYLGTVVCEARLDSAHFSDGMVRMLDEQGVEFTISVPFERFPELKRLIENRRRWYRVNSETWYFELSWKPASWLRRFRFIVVRRRKRERRKGLVQLDLFVPYKEGYEFKVIVTNKKVCARAVVAFHEGRGSQEGVLAELKSGCFIDYIPVRRLNGNQTYLLAGLFAHNLVRELQLRAGVQTRKRTLKRTSLWLFEKVDTIRKTIIQRAGRLTKPNGLLTLTISAGPQLKERLLRYLDILSNST